MRKGINLGNALEAPTEGEWGYRIEPEHLDLIVAAGFDGVRLPVRWDAHMSPAPPYAIETGFMARVADVVESALARGLKVQLDAHHFEALNSDPESQAARFAALWRQIADRFAGASSNLYFEPLNEPNGRRMTGRTVTRLQAAALEAIRPKHAERLAVLGGPNWNSIDGLRDWRPPPDAHSAVTVHYYEPHTFTHEGAEWLGADAPRFGRAWGTQSDIAAIQQHAARAADWSRTHGLPLQLGEFGVYYKQPLAQRALWLRVVREAFEAQGAGWCVWDFAGAFALWDRDARQWHNELLDALFR